ncbi:MAG: hypothetical protein GXO49_06900 [Chlorobi bacterium]|nr:hypothetical protein [Chlorobiota bacterium]
MDKQSFFEENAFLFWMLGLGIAIFMFVVGLNSSVFWGYKNELPWRREFIKKQILLEQIYYTENSSTRRKFFNEIMKFDKNSATADKYKSYTLFRPNPEIKDSTINTIIVVDKTVSVEASIGKIVSKDEKIKELFKEISTHFSGTNTILKDSVLEMSSASTILSISLLHYLLKANSNNDNKFSLFFYKTDTLISSPFLENHIMYQNQENYSKYRGDNEKNEITDLLVKILDNNNNDIKNQVTRFDTIYSFIKQFVDKNNNSKNYYHLIIISDFIDSKLFSKKDKKLYFNTAYKEKLLNAISELRESKKIAQQTLIQMIESDEYSKTENGIKIDALLDIIHRYFDHINYYHLDTKNNYDFQNNPADFLKRISLFSNRSEQNFVIYDGFNCINNTNVGIGFINNKYR